MKQDLMLEAADKLEEAAKIIEDQQKELEKLRDELKTWTERHYCCVCRVPFIGWGNNPDPLGEPGEKCCDHCNWYHVIPARLERTKEHEGHTS